jgi:DmsE family decaheme c-type cytochrome
VVRRPWVLILRMRFVVPLLAALVLLAGGQALAQAPAAAGWTASDCETCHDKALGAAFARSKHAGIDQSCASCHENVGEHFRAQSNGDKNGPVPSLKKLTANQINDKCLSCHEKANQANYLSSMHARRNVACTECHGIHDYKTARAQLKTKLDSETCFECHKSERAKAQRTSHHPVREGKMACASCHNPHDGARPKMLKAESVNEQCYQCHAEKRGPFLFEHAPVREDCVSCHDPHGSNHKRLLAQKLPNLCWNCHLTGSGHFGSGDNYSTELGARIAPPGAPSGYPTANSRFIEKSCKNCHVNLHGSNSPSGAYFIR